MLRREGSDPTISEKFYRSMFQAVIIFGSKTWVMSEAMLTNIEEVHVGLLRQMTGVKARRLGGETWKKEGPDRLLQAAENKPLRECINKSQAMVSELVALWPIFEVCAK